MEEKGKETTAAFDALLTTNHIQMLKVLLSYLPAGQQGALAVYIKFSELQYALEFLRRPARQPLFRGRPPILTGRTPFFLDPFSGDTGGILSLLEELLPFSSPGEREKIQNIQNLLASLGNIREMMEMMETMKDFFPDAAEGAGGMDPAAMADLFQMFQSMPGKGPQQSPDS